jgi:hypothetical protein
MRLVALLFVICLGGCKKAPDGTVAGTVTLDGNALPNAMVRFIPQGNTPGLGGTGRTDAKGNFVLADSQGGKTIQPGEYKVVISKMLRPDGSDPGSDFKPAESDARESLPPIYSSEMASTLKATVTSDAKPYDFPLITPKK